MTVAQELDAHYSRHIGPDHTSWGSSNKDIPPPVVIREWQAQSNQLEIHCYATFGMSLQTLRGVTRHGNELYSGVAQASPEYRDALAALASNARDSEVIFQDCQVLDLQSPVISGQVFTGWIFFDRSEDLIPALDISNGGHVVFLDTAPVFPQEIAYTKTQGVDALLDIWNTEGTEIWDLSRPVPRRLRDRESMP